MINQLFRVLSAVGQQGSFGPGLLPLVPNPVPYAVDGSFRQHTTPQNQWDTGLLVQAFQILQVI